MASYLTRPLRGDRQEQELDPTSWDASLADGTGGAAAAGEPAQRESSVLLGHWSIRTQKHGVSAHLAGNLSVHSAAQLTM